MRLSATLLFFGLISSTSFAQSTGPQSPAFKNASKRIPAAKISTCEAKQKLYDEVDVVLKAADAKKKNEMLYGWQLQIETSDKDRVTSVTTCRLGCSAKDEVEAVINGVPSESKTEEALNLLSSAVTLAKKIEVAKIREFVPSALSTIEQNGNLIGDKDQYRRDDSEVAATLQGVVVTLTSPKGETLKVDLSKSLVEKLKQEKEKQEKLEKQACAIIGVCEKTSEIKKLDLKDPEVMAALESYNQFATLLKKSILDTSVEKSEPVKTEK